MSAGGGPSIPGGWENPETCVVCQQYVLNTEDYVDEERGMRHRACPMPANGPHVEPVDTDIPYEDGSWDDQPF